VAASNVPLAFDDQSARSRFECRQESIDVHESGLNALLATAAFVGLFHTITGPDHYLPFVAMSRAGNWSLRKSLAVTACCGVGHVASSFLLGLAGVLLGVALSGLVVVEEFRGSVAGWLLLSFGLVYLVWGLRRAWRDCPHEHLHVHADGTVHSHPHVHDQEHAHAHSVQGPSVVTPWILFLIFVFGPCEPLIPLLIYPAATDGLGSSMLVGLVFAVATIGTMLIVVTVGCLGIAQLSARGVERFGHAICGAAVGACGAAMCLGF
jgi:sulfite exporter TauE/SafE